ncbi:hypothetical protein RQP46_006123 [Phenoliferia psychrophenolica]
MATIHSLATETLIEIFEELDRIGIPGASLSLRPNLCSCALVCQAWRAPAQLVLFGKVALGDRALYIVEPDQLILYGPHTHTLAWLFSPARTRYHTRHLCLSVNDIDIPRRWPADSGPLSFTINLDGLGVAFDLELPLENLLGSSSETLNSLYFIHVEEKAAAEILMPYFSSVAFPVTSITFALSDQTHSLPLCSCFLSLSRIEITFDLGRLSPQMHDAVGALLRLKNPSIEELSFGMAWFSQQPNDWEWLYSLIDLVELSRFPRLRHLRLPFAPKASFERESGVALLKLCKDRSIAVVSEDGYV